MKAKERRQQIITILKRHQEPLSASNLAKELGVSRQVIVGDVALLRASNHDILSTPKGYVLSEALYSQQFIGKIACQHDLNQTEEELIIIVQAGGTVIDVEVEHPVYGMLTASLNIKTAEDIQHFMAKIAASKAVLLSSLTQGIHVHTLSCPSKEVFDNIKQSLSQKGLLLK